MEIKRSILQSMFFNLLRIRLVEERIAEEYPKQEMRCPVHLCIGQEAIAVGVCNNLKQNDIVYSGHRSHGHYLAKGGNLKKMMAEIYCKKTGCAGGRGGSQHLIDLTVNFMGAVPIVAETIPIAVGSALASKMKQQNNITVVFFGEAAIEEGVTHESLNYAKLRNLPILFVCENNLYSTYTHIRERQPKREIFNLVKGHGISSYREDGNDVIKVKKLAGKAVAQVRNGKGPVFLEFMTYRQREHVGPNLDPSGYRDEKEMKVWIKRDPLSRLQKYLLKKKILSGEKIMQIKKRIEREIDVAFMFAQISPFPEELDEKQVYAE